MLTDPIADYFIRIKNALLKRKLKIVVPYSKIKEEITILFKNKKVIDNYYVKKDEKTGFLSLVIRLSYFQKIPLILNLKRISKPGCRIYSSYTTLYRYYSGSGFLIMSTSKGITDGSFCIKNKIGGEVLGAVS
ncbi:30S ribosomal protein S8 [symbiont of Argiope bruennichi]|uniref:uS8 family ribosomal protein n=1 Tax=symbiont of Argiope bruennichi TaxID=2810479 RepID=UPI003DA3EB02